MTPFIFLIPILFAIVLFIFFRKQVVWWEYLILIVPSLIITTLVYYGMISSSTSDVEYYGDHVTEIRYYEDWNEWITETCTETYTDADGNTQTRTYDCSHSEYHSEYWTQVTATGNELNISKKEYNRLSKLWNTNKIFVDMRRDYYTNDGDMYRQEYDNNIFTSKTITTTHHYVNKIPNSYSVFGFSKITEDDAKKIGLYDYPELVSNKDNEGIFSSGSLDQSPFLGYKPTKKELSTWKYINGVYGPKYQIRIFILYFYNQSPSIVQEQKSYWYGGNKNELIYCFGLDSITKKIQWVDAFSWSDKPTLEVNFRSFYSDKERVNLYELATWTQNSVPKMWHRKEFKDFDYIDIQLTGNQMLWLFIIVMFVNLALSLFIIYNSFSYDKDGNIIDSSYSSSDIFRRYNKKIFRNRW